jgi:class 3 adenylate cyclase
MVFGSPIRLSVMVRSISGAGEVIVSGVVADLVTGAGIEFEDRGEHELKGLPGRWQLLKVASA